MYTPRSRDRRVKMIPAIDTVAEDKVLISIRFNFPLTLIPPVLLTYLQIFPLSPTALTFTSNKFKLASSTTTTPSKTPASTEYTYHNVLSGSENK